MDLNLTTISFLLSILAIFFAVFSFSKNTTATRETPAGTAEFNSTPLRLQAYERLLLLTERMALPSLISRLNQPQLSATEMKVMLAETIKQEFDHNITQQLYVSTTAWEAVRNLKEQQILLINQVAASLDDRATGAQLNKKLLELLLAQSEGALPELVASTLRQEAQRWMR